MGREQRGQPRDLGEGWGNPGEEGRRDEKRAGGGQLCPIQGRPAPLRAPVDTGQQGADSSGYPLVVPGLGAARSSPWEEPWAGGGGTPGQRSAGNTRPPPGLPRACRGTHSGESTPWQPGPMAELDPPRAAWTPQSMHNAVFTWG